MERIRLNYVGSDLPSGSYAQDNRQFLDGELRIELTIARPRDPIDQEQLQDYLSSTRAPLQPMRVSVPTRAVFAEAVLG